MRVTLWKRTVLMFATIVSTSPFVLTNASAQSTAASIADSEARAVVGFEQAGASATRAEQHFFFDFFIDRRMKSEKLSLWGNVRVASYPQQIDTPVAQFAADLTTQLGNVKVNQLAESAEFGTGLDYHPWKWGLGSGVERRFGFIFSVGANGPFEPSTRLRLFQVPDRNSPQFQAFTTRFPQTVASMYVGFIPPDRFRFYRAWGAGIRILTSYSTTDMGTARAPATYSVTIGQDENVSGGSLKGAVAKFDVFYPLPISSSGSRFLFLFGNANLRVAGGSNITPFVLAPAPTTVTGAEASVAIVTVPSNRDVYRLGLGIDAIGFICTLRTDKCESK